MKAFISFITFAILVFTSIASGQQQAQALQENNSMLIRPINMSARTTVGAYPLIVGFVVVGSEPHTYLIRAVGPTLTSFGVKKPCVDPKLAIYDGGCSELASNDNWESGITSSTKKAGAFALNPNSKDAAVLVTLSAGNYTAVATCASSEEGVALLELYDLDIEKPGGMMNMSTLGFCGTGENKLTAGVTLSGIGQRFILFRAISQGLKQLGVEGTMEDPTLSLYDSSVGKMFLYNDNWSLINSGDSLGAFPLQRGSKDAIVYYNADWEAPISITGLLSRVIGKFSAEVGGAELGEGLAIVEVYVGAHL